MGYQDGRSKPPSFLHILAREAGVNKVITRNIWLLLTFCIQTVEHNLSYYSIF